MHYGFETSNKRLLASVYYFEGITSHLKNYINKCPICQIKRSAKIIDIPEKPIINYGPHIEYQIDLFYLPDDI